MATTINNIKVDFGLGATPPRVTFLQGANMDVTFIRDTLRQIEESEEGRSSPGAISSAGDAKGWIVRAGGNFPFSESESSALTVAILSPFEIFFEAGPIPFVSTTGSLLGTFIDSPGAIVQINNAIGASNLNSEDIQYASFGRGVWVKLVGGSSGVTYPTGTERNPVNNFADALTIAAVRGFDTFYILGDAIVTAGLDYTNFKFRGQGQNNTLITITDTANVNNCSFFDATITGILDDSNRLIDCLIETITSLDGFMQNCGVNDSITLGGSSQTTMVDCYSNVAGQYTPFLSLGSGSALVVRGWKGGLELRDKTGTDEVSFDLGGGQVIVASSCVAGEMTIRGIGKLVNNSGGTVIVEEILDSRNLNKAVFIDGAVHFNSTAPSSGTAFPYGTPASPVNDLADAISIANTNGLDKISFIGFATATASHNLDGLEVFGGTGSNNVLNLAGCSTFTSAFSRLIIYGALNGLSRIHDCIIGTTGLGGMTGIEGRIVDCIINHADGITQDASGAGTLFDNCSFIAPDDPQITLDANGKGFSLRRCTGNILIENKTDPDTDQINIVGARIELASSCTAGEFIIAGVGQLTDTSGGTVVTNNLDTTKLTEVHQIHGLESGSPMTVTPTGRNVANISQVISGDGETTSTVTRS